jgi:hypothetical protein
VFSRARLGPDGEVSDDALLAALRHGLARLVELAAAPPNADDHRIELAPIDGEA